ncbi:MAG: hypothetical protein JRH11_04935 [Deltaproteobacteria bacterium]|nr:hypothetical protein [Deltaproteobacteria bacterium]
MSHVIAILSIAALCVVWGWLQRSSGCDEDGGCGTGRCGACRRAPKSEDTESGATPDAPS